MNYDFNREVNRDNSNSLKWDLRKTRGGDNVLPMWVADMDFKAPREVVSAIEKRAAHGVFGYTYCSGSYFDSVVEWMGKRHQWHIEKDWILTTPGVVSAVSVAILSFTKPGDRVLIQPPVYHPFKKVIIANDRVPVENELRRTESGYEMDFCALERLIVEEGVSLVILCSPHNPVGRVWKRDELLTFLNICRKNSVVIISDEIHSDLVMPGFRHSPMASLSDDAASMTVTLTSASKSFNLAGLSCSNVVISNRKLHESFDRILKGLSIGNPNIFGLVATEAAYRYGEEWLEQLLLHLKNNRDFMGSYIGQKMPEIRVTPLEGTYLAWLDFSKTGFFEKDVSEIILKRAGVWLENGSQFGKGGEGFLRINLACSHNTLSEALSRISGTLGHG